MTKRQIPAILALTLALSGCGGAKLADAEQDEVAACQRADVQESVATMFKHHLLKNMDFFQRVTLDEGGFAASKIQFVKAVDTDIHRKGDMITSIDCNGWLKIDDSNYEAGQQIAEMRDVKWTIHFTGGGSDASSLNYTVALNEDTLLANVYLNGQSLNDILKAEREQKAREDDLAEAYARSADERDNLQEEGSSPNPEAEDTESDLRRTARDSMGDEADELAITPSDH